MAITICKEIFDAIDQLTEGMLAGGTTQLMNTVSSMFCCCTCIYFGIKALIWYKDGVDLPIMDILWEFIRLAVIGAFSFTVPYYIAHIVPFVTNLPNEIIAILGQHETSTNALDDMLTVYIKSMLDFYDKLNFSFGSMGTAFAGLFILVLYFIGGLPFILISFATLMVTKIATQLFLILGPLFIAFAMFPATKDLFNNWWRLMAALMLTNILFNVSFSFESAFINTMMINGGKIDITWPKIFAMVLTFTSFFFLAKAIPGFASTLTGGGHAVSGLGISPRFPRRNSGSGPKPKGDGHSSVFSGRSGKIKAG
ncbi:type IV secretion system protein [Salmonella enterica]|nr:type IV secretion system protein [Salmonella enterica]